MLANRQVIALHKRGVDHLARAVSIEHGLDIGHSADNSSAIDADETSVHSFLVKLTIEKAWREEAAAFARAARLSLLLRLRHAEDLQYGTQVCVELVGGEEHPEAIESIRDFG